MDWSQIAPSNSPQTKSEGVGACKIHVLGLAPLKDRLGPKWDRMSKHVHMFFDAAVKRHLRPGDSFLHAGELSYVLTFPGLSLVESQMACAAIAQEVCTRLFGENGEHVLLRNLVAEMDAAAISLTSGSTALIDEFLEQTGIESIISPGTKQAAGICEARTVSQRSNGGVPSAETRGPYTYRPVWDVTSQAVLTYLCHPESSIPKNQKLGGATAVPAELVSDSARCKIDIGLLNECSNRIAELHRAGLKVLLGVPVHFGTISHGRSWSEYGAVYRRISPEIAANLAFFVHNIEPGVPHIRLAQELPKLSTGGHRLFCSLTNLEVATAQFANTSAHAIGLSLDSSPLAETRLFADMKLLKHAAQAAGVHTYILGVPSTSLALYALEAGIRYLEGGAIRPAVTDPRNAFVHGIEDLYLPKHSAPVRHPRAV